MVDSPVQHLLDAVRHRLWVRQVLAAGRRALWASAVLGLTLMALHLTIMRVPIVAALASVATLWTACLGWSGFRRPTDATCALWADRHLDGASAFTTWLDLGKPIAGHMHDATVERFAVWVQEQVPSSRRRLNSFTESAQLGKPLAVMMTTAALAGLVLKLPGPTPTPVRPAAASPDATTAASRAERPVSDADVPSTRNVVGDVARALRATGPITANQRAGAGAESAAASGKADSNGIGDASRSRLGALAPDKSTTGQSPMADAIAGSWPTAGTAQTAAAGAGREAGLGLDDRAGFGQSRALTGNMPVRGFVSKALREPADRQVDVDRTAVFDDARASQTSLPAPAGRAAAAAGPPVDSGSMRLTTIETSYVQAWIKATSRR